MGMVLHLRNLIAVICIFTLLSSAFAVPDSTPPVWSLTLSDQVIEFGTGFSYGIIANDESTISYNLSDNVNFTINSTTGLIKNVTLLNVGNYPLAITATDASGNANNSNITVIITARPRYNVSGYVFDNDGIGLGEVLIQSDKEQNTTSSSGYYSIVSLPNGTYNLTYSKAGFNPDYLIVSIDGTDNNSANKTIFDTLSPGQGTGLRNDTPTRTTINLSWDKLVDANYYQVYRNSTDLGYTKNS